MLNFGKRSSSKSSAKRDQRSFHCEPLEPRLVMTGDLCLTEFMASNNNTLVDSFGDNSDWIELYNNSSATIDLSQYSLTDDAADLTKFPLPALNLNPGSTIVVFASGRDLVTAGGEVHTNFSLAASGEYLALVDDNEVVVQDFGTAYPPQQEDTSFGVEMFTSGSAQTLLAGGATGRTLTPSTDIGSSWISPAFNDASWANATLPIGYERGSGYQNLINTNVTEGTTSVYLRIPFNLSSLDATGNLTLGVRYDDGFVAYLNGVEVTSAGAPETPTWNSTATENHDDSLAVNFQPFDISGGQSLLQVGQNVLAVHALNVNSSSSDFLFDAEITGLQTGITQPVEVGFLSSPSPGGTNSATFEGFVDEVFFSLSHGFYDAPQSLALATPTAGATIVYTTDGSDPQVDANLNPTNGTTYNGPLTISETTVLRASAFAPNRVPTISRAQTYLFTGDIIQQSPNGETPFGWPTNGDATLNGQYLDYGIDPDILNQYGSVAVENALKNISTISLTTDLDNLFNQENGLYSNAFARGRSTEKFTSVELIEPDGSTTGFQVNAGLRIRGGFSRNDFFAKHNLRLFFRSEYGDSKLDYELFGSEGAEDFDVLDLRSAQNYSWGEGGSDRLTFLREIVSRDTQADLGHPHTRSRYHHLYMNGIYWGVYQTQERVEAYFGESYFGGDEDDYDRVKADNSNGLRTHFPDGNDQAWRDTFDLTQAIGVNPSANADNYWTVQGLNTDGTRNPDLPVLLDIDNLIDYMMIIFYSGGTDTGLNIFSNNSVANNWVAVRNRATNDTGWQFFIHDNEHSFGVNKNDFLNGQTQPIQQDRTGPFNNGNQNSFEFSSPPFIHQDLLSHPEYQLRWQDRVQKHFFNDGGLTREAFLERWNERQATVDSVIIAHAARWGDRYDENNQGFAPRDRQTWLNEVNFVKNTWLPPRNNIVLNQLTNDNLHSTIAPANFNQFGGVVNNGFGVTLNTTAGGGTIYYTTDGSDPRRVGGAVSSSALTYNSSIPVTDNVTINARVRLPNGDWSAITEGTFRLPAVAADASNLRITELNYHPTDPTSTELTAVPSATANSFEFIEFVNTSANDIDLTGVQITRPLTFAFPTMNLAPGERALVVRDDAAFDARYSSLIPTVGAYGDANGLSDGGDTITVVAANGSTIQSFTYNDSGDWPSSPDGDGATLQIIDTGGDYDDSLNWLTSRNDFGTPGFGSSPVASTSGLRITEVNYNPTAGSGAEFIEIQNDSATPINLAGVQLVEGVEFDFTDSAISFLQPGEFALVVGNETTFNSVYGAGLPVAGAFTNGSLSNGGERITLFDSAGNSIHDFVYDDVSPWALSADGGGSSLEIVSTSGNYSSAGNWEASSVSGGTPGSLGGALPCDYVGGSDGCDLADIDALYAGTNGAPGPLTNALIQQWLTDASDAANPLKANVADVYLIGDVDLSGDVDSTDLGLMLNNFAAGGGFGWGSGNLDTDGTVDSTDLGLLLNNFGHASAAVAATSVSVSVPEVPDPEAIAFALLPDSSATSSTDSYSVRDLVFGEIADEEE